MTKVEALGDDKKHSAIRIPALSTCHLVSTQDFEFSSICSAIGHGFFWKNSK